MTGPVHYDCVETLVLDHFEQAELALINGAVWPRVGDVIELSHPTRDAVVTGVRLQLRQDDDDGNNRARIIVLVQDGEPGDTIAREPLVEALLEPVDDIFIEPPVPIVIEPI